MKILQVHNYYAAPGGEDAIADTEADILEEAGHEVVRVRVRNAVSRRSAAQALAAAPLNVRQESSMRARIAAVRPDVVHVHNTWFTLSPSVVRPISRQNVPVVVELQSYRLLCVKAQLFRNERFCTDCVGTHPWRGVLHRCYRGSATESMISAATIAINRRRHTWDGVDRFLAPSTFVKDVFVAAGTSPERIIVKPSVVADPGARSHPPSRSRDVLFAGRLAPEKGVGVLLEAWRRAQRELTGLRLVVVGDGPLRPRLEGLLPDVRFVGWLDQARLGSLMLSARAMVFPSQWVETYGRSIVEAMAAGLPVLASDVAGPGELARQQGAEWVITPHDSIEKWAAGLPRLGDDDAIDAAGGRARSLFESKYTYGAGLDRLLEIYQSILADQQPAAVDG